MNASCPTNPVPVNAPPARGWFASLERLINTAGFVSVDLTDTIFASLPHPEDVACEPAVPPVPFSQRPAPSRMLSAHLP
jgi:hypothetical protein